MTTERELEHRLCVAASRVLTTRRSLGVTAARYDEGVMIGLAQALTVVTGAPVHQVVRRALDGAMGRPGPSDSAQVRFSEA